MTKLTIRANVVDLGHDTPKSDDKFLVDTNVWYWMAYPNASLNPVAPQAYQVEKYPTYLSSAIDKQSAIYWSSLTLAELAHNIESSERQVYSATAGREIKPKEYRHGYRDQRIKTNNIIRDSWNVVKQIGSCAETVLDEAATDDGMATFLNAQIDGYDLFILTAMRSKNLSSVITDDGDYATVRGITVFTANQSVIEQARAAGKLLQR